MDRLALFVYAIFFALDLAGKVAFWLAVKAADGLARRLLGG